MGPQNYKPSTLIKKHLRPYQSITLPSFTVWKMSQKMAFPAKPAVALRSRHGLGCYRHLDGGAAAVAPTESLRIIPTQAPLP